MGYEAMTNVEDEIVASLLHRNPDSTVLRRLGKRIVMHRMAPSERKKRMTNL